MASQKPKGPSKSASETFFGLSLLPHDLLKEVLSWCQPASYWMLRSTSLLWNQLLKEITTTLPAWIVPGHVSRPTLMAHPYLKTLSLKSNTHLRTICKIFTFLLFFSIATLFFSSIEAPVLWLSSFGTWPYELLRILMYLFCGTWCRPLPLVYLTLDSTTNCANEDQVDDNDLSIVTKLMILDLSWNARLTDVSLSFAPHIHTLNLCCTAGVTDEGLLVLPNLTDLNLTRNSRITDEGLSKLIKLRILSLESNQCITDRGITSLTALTSLNLTDNKQISISALAPLKLLQELDLTRNYFASLETVTPETMPCITSLTSLNLQRSKRNMITDAQFQNLSNSLTHLNLLGCNWGSYSNAGISCLTRLRWLNLSYNSVVSDASLSCLVSITSLNLSNNNSVTDNALMFLANLTFLDLDRNNNITSASIQYLSKLSQLRLSSYSSTNYHLFMRMQNQ